MVKRAVYILICFFTLYIPVHGQPTIRDSLNRLVNTSNDTSKVQVLNKISRLLESNNPDSAFIMADSALGLAEKINYPFGMGISYLSMGSCQTTSGKYDLAINNLLKALKILEKLKNKRAVTNAYNTVANTYLGLKNKDKAYEFFLKSFRLASQPPRNEFMIAVTSVGLGGILLENKKFEAAIQYFQKAETYFRETNNLNYEAMATSMIGESYFKSGDLFKAEKYYRKVLPVFRKIKDDYALANTLNNLGDLELQRKNYHQAAIYLEESLNLNIKRNALDNIQSAALNLSKALEAQKQPEKALWYYKIYMQYKDSVVNIQRNRAVAEAESKYESEKKETELQLKNMELATSRLQVSQRNRLIYIFAVVTVVVVGLLFFVYKQFSEKRKTNVLLLHKNEEVQKQKSIIEEKNKDITDSINYARHIQQAILPSPQAIKENFPESFVIFKPKDIVSGDFYLLERDQECVYLAVVDCTGHGVPGAMLSVFAHSALKNIIHSSDFKHNPAGILKALCHQFKTDLQSNDSSLSINDGVDMAICVLHRRKNILYFAGAKSNLLRVKQDKMDTFMGDRYGISGTNSGIQTEFTDFVIDLEKHDQYYLFTDGFADQFGGPKGKKFKQKHLEETLLTNSGLTFQQQATALTAAFENWRGGLEQLDDVTLIGFKM